MPAVGGAHPQQAGRPCPRKTAWTRGAPYAPPLAGRGPDGCPRAAPGRPGSSRSRAETAKRDTHSTSTSKTLHIIRTGQTSLCSSTNPNLIGRPRPSDERGLSRGMSRSIESRAFSRLSRAFSAARSAGDEPGSTGVVERRRGVIVPGSPYLLDPPPKHRLVQPQLVRHRDDRHPARANPLHRLALELLRELPPSSALTHLSLLQGLPTSLEASTELGQDQDSEPHRHRGLRWRGPQVSCSTRSSRPSTSAGPRKARGSLHTRIAARNISPFAARSVSPPASSRRWAVSGTATTMPSAWTVIGLFKTEAIRRRGPWRGLEAVELATLEPKVRAKQRMDALVQSPPPARADRAHPARRGRGALPRPAGERRHGGLVLQLHS